MRVRRIDHGLTLAAPAPGYVRSKGLHMSDLYGAYYKATEPKKFDKRDAQGNPVPMDSAKMELGLTFEEILEPALAQRVLGERPGEFVTQHDPECPCAGTKVEVGDEVCSCGAGIAYSPDHLFFNGVTILGEFKLTWYSNRTGITDSKFAKWFTQMRLYAYHLQVRHARLIVFFVNGNYKPPTPELCAWDIEFSERELIDEWRMMLRFGKSVGLIPRE